MVILFCVCNGDVWTDRIMLINLLQRWMSKSMRWSQRINFKAENRRKETRKNALLQKKIHEIKPHTCEKWCVLFTKFHLSRFLLTVLLYCFSLNNNISNNGRKENGKGYVCTFPRFLILSIVRYKNVDSSKQYNGQECCLLLNKTVVICYVGEISLKIFHTTEVSTARVKRM